MSLDLDFKLHLQKELKRINQTKKIRMVKAKCKI